MSLDRNRSRALLGSSSGSITLSDLDTGKPLRTIVLKNPVTSVALAGNRFVAGDEQGIVAFFEVLEA